MGDLASVEDQDVVSHTHDSPRSPTTSVSTDSESNDGKKGRRRSRRSRTHIKTTAPSTFGGFAKVLLTHYLKHRNPKAPGRVEDDNALPDHVHDKKTELGDCNSAVPQAQPTAKFTRSMSVPVNEMDMDGKRKGFSDDEGTSGGILQPATHSRVLLKAYMDHRPKSTTFSFNNPNIYFIGRVHWATPERPMYDWAGTTVGFKFEGTSVSIRMNGGGNYFNVFIDGVLNAILATNNSEAVYLLADQLDDRAHTFELHKRSESFLCTPLSNYKPVELIDLRIDGNRTLLKPRQRMRRARRIEYIGDSDVAGFGNEYNSPKDDFVPHLCNSYASFGAKLARMFEAESHIIALSGKGVVHNAMDLLAWDGKSTSPMISYYDRTLAKEKSIKWNPSNYQADCVVIYLGSNDYLDYNNVQYLPIRPTDSEFTNGYLEIIQRARHCHPNASIFTIIPNDSCVTYEGKPHVKIVNTLRTCILAACAKAADSNVHPIELKTQLMYPADFGAIHHWNTRASSKIARELAEHISDVMKWDYLSEIDWNDGVLDTPIAQPS